MKKIHFLALALMVMPFAANAQIAADVKAGIDTPIVKSNTAVDAKVDRRAARHEKWQSMTQEQRDAKKAEHKAKWDAKTDAEKAEWKANKKAKWDSLSAEQKADIRANKKAHWDSLSAEQKAKIKAHHKN